MTVFSQAWVIYPPGSRGWGSVRSTPPELDGKRVEDRRLPKDYLVLRMQKEWWIGKNNSVHNQRLKTPFSLSPNHKHL